MSGPERFIYPHGKEGNAELQWQKNDTLPSFYSPRATATDASTVDEIKEQPLSPQGQDDKGRYHPLATMPREMEDGNQEQQPHHPSLNDSQLPPPSLLSPAFTPPATPGSTLLNKKAEISHTSNGRITETRGVPVDSSLSSGGCGTKKPRLLDTLPHVECIVRARIPTVTGTQMFLHLYTNNIDKKEHLAIVFGDHIRSKSLDAPRPGETERDRMTRGAYTGVLYPGRTKSGMKDDSYEIPALPSEVDFGPPLVRVHSECYTGETVWSARCDCGEQLDEAARLMSLPASKAGGIIIYLRQEGRGIGLGEKLKAYNLQDLGSDTVEANLLLRHPADARSYGLATAMLLDLGQTEVRLLTNNPDKIRAVEGPSREVIVKERVPMVPLSWRGEGGFRSREVDGYLSTKVYLVHYTVCL